METLGRKWIIVFAIALHMLWGALLLLDGENAAHITAIHTSLNIFRSHVLLGIIYLVASVLAIFAAWRFSPNVFNLAMVLPQQFMLMVSAIGACIAIWTSRFADGVERPMAFIMADQAPAVLMAIFHSCALLEIYTNVFSKRIK